jgi:hypothetical protein
VKTRAHPEDGDGETQKQGQQRKQVERTAQEEAVHGGMVPRRHVRTN